MRKTRWIVGGLLMLAMGCASSQQDYGRERSLILPGKKRQAWAVAPVVNLSGQRPVDPLLQADLLFVQLQQVEGITALPVNRVAEVYASLRIDKVQSEEQAARVCEFLGCDALLVASVSIYDPYSPPKMGAALQLFQRDGRFARPKESIDPRELARRATPAAGEPLPASAAFAQAVGMFDSANGSVRESVMEYAAGRSDPAGPFGAQECLVDMDRYSGFVWHSLLANLLRKPQLAR